MIHESFNTKFFVSQVLVLLPFFDTECCIAVEKIFVINFDFDGIASKNS